MVTSKRLQGLGERIKPVKTFSEIFKWFSEIIRDYQMVVKDFQTCTSPYSPKSLKIPWKSLKNLQNLCKFLKIFGAGMRERQKRGGPEAKLCCNQEKTISQNHWKPSENLRKSLKILTHFKPKSEKNVQTLWRYMLFSNGFSLNIKH